LTAPSFEPAGRTRRPHRAAVVFPLLLIFVGGVFLLQNLGYLPPNYWLNLWRLWPLVLVLIGVELLFGSRVPTVLLAGIAAVILIGGALVGGVPGATTPPAASTINPTLTQTLDGAARAVVNVRFDAGELQIGSLGVDQENLLASASYMGPADLVPQPRYTLSGDTGRLEYAASQRGGAGSTPFIGGTGAAPRLALSLNPRVPISSLSIKTGATDSRLDLSGLQIDDLDLAVGAASTWLRFPAEAGTTSAQISGGASSITLEIPPGVAARIRTRGGLSTVNVNQARFPSVGDQLYRSPDYDTAPNRIDVSIDTGITSIQVN
jgi:hypothetical protein